MHSLDLKHLFNWRRTKCAKSRDYCSYLNVLSLSEYRSFSFISKSNEYIHSEHGVNECSFLGKHLFLNTAFVLQIVKVKMHHQYNISGILGTWNSISDCLQYIVAFFLWSSCPEKKEPSRLIYFFMLPGGTWNESRRRHTVSLTISHCRSLYSKHF